MVAPNLKAVAVQVDIPGLAPPVLAVDGEPTAIRAMSGGHCVASLDATDHAPHMNVVFVKQFTMFPLPVEHFLTEPSVAGPGMPSMGSNGQPLASRLPQVGQRLRLRDCAPGFPVVSAPRAAA